MRVWTKVVSVWDEAQGRYVADESCSDWYEYEGEVAFAKGDSTAKQTEILQQQNAQQQMAFNQQLISIFQQQFGKQSAINDYLQAKMQPLIDNPTGYSAEALAAMRTSATDTLSNQYQNAQKALQATQFAQGGRDLPSGVNAQLNAALFSQEAADKANTQNTITLQNENLKQANYWNAVNELNGVGASFNPQSYAGAATGASQAASSAGNSAANLSQAYTASQQSQLMGALGGLAGGVFGAAGQAGGFGKLFCWVAAAAFNEDFRTGTKTNLVRGYLLGEFSTHWYAAPVLAAYSRFGERISKVPFLVRMLKPLFEAIVRKAERNK